jgi:hypothetical protein
MNATPTPGQHGPVPVPPPPAAGPATGQRPPQEPASPSGAGRTIAIVTAVVGGFCLLGAGLGVGLSTAAGLGVSDEVQTQAVGGLASLSVDSSASEFRVVFDDVEEAVLETTSSSGRWSLSREGDGLAVSRSGVLFGWFGGGLFGDGLFGEDWSDREERVVLRLPERLQRAGLDLDVDVSAGSFSAEGDFGEVDLGLGAGALMVGGSAESLDVDLSAGYADLAFADVAEADFAVSAGWLEAVLSGETPREVGVDVSAGTADITLPRDVYAVGSDVSAGSFDNLLDVSEGSPNRVFVDLSAGDVSLRPGR